MEGEDDRGLGQAQIVYGARELTRQPNGTSVTIDGILEDTAATSPDDDQVRYVLTMRPVFSTTAEIYHLLRVSTEPDDPIGLIPDDKVAQDVHGNTAGHSTESTLRVVFRVSDWDPDSYWYAEYTQYLKGVCDEHGFEYAMALAFE